MIDDREVHSQLYVWLGDRTSNPDGDVWDHDRLRVAAKDLTQLVRRLMQQQAAEELREAADRSGLMSSEHGKTIPVADLRDRAAALAPEPQS